MAEKYAIGLDFGTLSGRAVLVGVRTGVERAQSVKDYTRGVLDEALPDGTPLPAGWALADPEDYLETLEALIRSLMEMSGVGPEEIAGIGLDVTSDTFLPVDAQGVPLCMKTEYRSNPHAWMKLWKHHGAAGQAERMTALAGRRGEPFLNWCGGAVNAEWLLPKLAETSEEAPDVYEGADCFMEAGDWLIRCLTGEHTRSGSVAGYKGLYHARTGFPDGGYLREVSPLLEHAAEEKLGGRLTALGEIAGRLTEEAARRLGLMPGTPVAAAAVDAHAAYPAAGICGTGELLMVLGTSCVALVCAEKEHAVPGCVAVEGGLLPGYFGYEAGQSSVGDTFGWFVQNCVPEAYASRARESGMSLHSFLTSKAGKLCVGESGLIALDWWNGNRSCLADAGLKGMMVGLTLATKPEEIYRALIEASAYGMRMILDTLEDGGVPVRKVCACGGIARKNPMMMQIYANVLEREIRLTASDQASAFGSAVFGAVAGGAYRSVAEASEAMGRVAESGYRPDPADAAAYRRLYQEYVALHDYFGRGGNDVMKRVGRR